MTAPTSAYPISVEDLLPAASDLTARLGEIPSRNRLMTEFKIGAPKASKLRELLEFPTDVAKPTVEPTETSVEPTVTVSAGLGPADQSVPEPVVPAEPVTAAPAEPTSQAAVDGHPVPKIAARPVRGLATWPVYLIGIPAFVAIWSGWVGLGTMTGFGIVHPLPGIADSFSLNTAITLPIGVEVYAAYALRAWLAGSAVPVAARRFAKWSAIGSLLVGSAGQVAYHLMESAGMTSAPWQITTAVSCLPVAVLGMGAALAHLLNSHDEHTTD